jgi:hypothetical protein
MHSNAAQGSVEELRCLSCEVVYEPSPDAGPGDSLGCPACGAFLWLAAKIPSAHPREPDTRATSQVSQGGGVFYDVGGKADGSPVLTLLESVRCLACGAIYSKPADGGTALENPGCPECGYVGWVIAGMPTEEDPPQRRSAADPQPGLQS